MYKKGTENDKQRKDAGNRTLCPLRNFSQAVNTGIIVLFTVTLWMPKLASYWFNWFIRSFAKYQKRSALSGKFRHGSRYGMGKGFPCGFTLNPAGWIDKMNTRLFWVFSHSQCSKVIPKKFYFKRNWVEYYLSNNALPLSLSSLTRLFT